MASTASMQRGASVSISSPPPFSLSLLSPPKRTYDVFLSNRVDDTAQSFTIDLYEALTSQGIVVFRHEADGGKPMAEKLKAVEESRSSIVVFSENYADSIHLKELTKIVKCKELVNQLVLPIFHQVDPANARYQIGNYETPFSEHEANVENDLEEVQTWRDSMNKVSHLSGWHLKDTQSEAGAIKEVVKHVFNKLRPDLFRYDEKLVGISSRLHRVNMLLGIGLDDVRIVGIWGMGGIGKTTIARIIYTSVAHEFEGHYFFDNVKEAFKDESLTSMQEKLLSGALMKRNIEIPDGDGATLIKRRISNIKALIVLDDVNQLIQLQKLAGSDDWFGPGSRVIITTRDEHLLSSHGVERRYNVEELKLEEALLLFSQKAFRANYPKKAYFDLASQVVDYAGGLPLAIEVLGSALRDKPMEAWKNAVDKLKEVRDMQIIEKLKVSYYMLEKSEQKIFLDIACFFKRKSKRQAIEMLQSFGFPAIIGLEILEEKSLLTTPHDKIQMHDLIQEMGQDIVCRMSPDKPEKRSRLWLREDINLALSHDQGTEAIEGIVMDLNEKGESHLNPKSFIAMTNLRVLKINNAYLSGDLEYLSDQLRVLNWHGYPLKCLPSNFHPQSLIELELPYSSIEHLWKGSKSLDTLKVINLSDSQFISKTPDFTGVPNLERLILSGCVRLFELHRSLGTLKGLIQLDLKDCTRLRGIPFNISLESLVVLTLSGCSRLKNFPKIVGDMKHLSELHLDGTSIQELHPSIGYLTGLVLLNLENCTDLLKLPSNIGCLTSLKLLTLRGCSKLVMIPESLGSIACLEKLDVTGTCIHQAPQSLQLLTNLEILDCQGLSRKFIHSLFPHWNFSWNYSHSQGLKWTYCFAGFGSMRVLNLSHCDLLDGDLPNNLQSLPSIQTLDLSGNNFTRLPDSLAQLVNLRTLILVDCSRLRQLPKLPVGVRNVEARDCVSLKEYYNHEKQMPSSATGMTVISCPITAELQNFKIARIDLSSIHLRTMVQRYIEVLTWQQEEYFFVIPYTQLITCFDHKKFGSSITVHFLQDTSETDDNMRIGVALCAFFEVQSHGSVGSETSCNFIIRLETDDCPLKSPLVFGRNEDKLRPPRGLLVFFIPFRRISYWLSQTCCVDVSITPTNPNVKVKACGASLLFEQDGGKFIGTIMKGLFGSPDFVHKFMIDHILNRQKQVEISSLLEGETSPKTYWLNALHRTVGSLPKFQPSRQQNAIQGSSSSNTSIEHQVHENDSTIMLKRSLKSVLCRTFEDMKLNGEYYIFPLKEISGKWFTLQVRQPLVKIEVPPNLHKDKKWMGLTLFAIFSLEKKSTITQSFSYQVEFEGRSLGRPSIIRLHDGAFNDSHQLWVCYEPRDVYPYRLNKWRNLRVSFLPHCSDTKVVFCGARLLYKQDLDGFIQTIIDSVLGCSLNLHEFYNQVFLEGMLSLIRSQKYDPDQEEEEEDSDDSTTSKAKEETRGANRASTSTSSLLTTASSLNDYNGQYFQLMESLQFFFQRSLQHRYESAFDFIIPGRDVPQLFSRQPERNRASIQLPPTLYTNNNWIGFVVCTLLYVNKSPTAIVNNLGTEVPHDLMCQFEIEQGLLKPLHIHTTIENEWLWLDERQFVWLYYTPRKTFGNILCHCSYIRAIVETDSPELAVRRCGIYLLHNQDREKIDQILMESISSTPTRSCN